MVDIKYIAGFIDGEGSISAHSSQKGSPCITIVNSDLDIINEISQSIEYLVGTRPHPSSRYRHNYTNLGGDIDKYKTIYILRLGTPILRKLLSILIPELRVKRQQGIWLQELVSLIRPISGPHNDGRGSQTWEARQELVDKIHWANQGYT